MSKIEQDIVAKIPADTRRKVLDLWLPNAAPRTGHNPAWANLWSAYYIYIDPNGVPKPDCAQCVQNVWQAWAHLKPYLEAANAAAPTPDLLNDLYGDIAP